MVVSIEFFTLVLIAGTAESLAAYAAGGSMVGRIAIAVLVAVSLLVAGGATLRRVYKLSWGEAAVGVVFMTTAFAVMTLFAMDTI